MVEPFSSKEGLVGRMTLYFMESGIRSYWMNEYFQLKYSARVQERGRVISSTEIRYNFEDRRLILPLELHRKISAVFFLWMLCLLISGICFLGEVVVYWHLEAMLLICSINIRYLYGIITIKLRRFQRCFILIMKQGLLSKHIRFKLILTAFKNDNVVSLQH